MNDPIERAQHAVRDAIVKLGQMKAAAAKCRDGVSHAEQALEAARFNLRKALQSDADRLANQRAHELSSLTKQIEEQRHVR